MGIGGEASGGYKEPRRKASNVVLSGNKTGTTSTSRTGTTYGTTDRATQLANQYESFHNAAAEMPEYAAVARAQGIENPTREDIYDVYYAARAAGNTGDNTSLTDQAIDQRRSGGSSGGGGGGGGVTSATVDLGWLASLLGAGEPEDLSFTALDLPDYTGTFDPTVFNELEGKLGTAVDQSRTAANTAYGNLENYLNTNYRNAFAGGVPAYQQLGTDQAAMQRMLQAQGVNPNLATANAQGQAAGNSAFANIWALLGANEDTAQRNRLNRVQTDRGTTEQALQAALLGGQTGIGLQRGQAQAAFNQQAEEARAQIAQQEALANWTRQNEVNQLNLTNDQAYRNQQLEALLGLLPQFMAQGTYPDLAAMGLA